MTNMIMKISLNNNDKFDDIKSPMCWKPAG